MAKRRTYLVEKLVVDKPIAPGTEFWPDMQGHFVIVESNDPNYPHVASFPCESQANVLGACSEAWDKAQQVADDLLSGKLTLEKLARNDAKVIKMKH